MTQTDALGNAPARAPAESGAGPAWLSEHPAFPDLVRAAADALGILPVFVEKDYWVTRVLRTVAADPGLTRQVVFKGGTSLSKGWGLIERFSEDVDLLLTGPAYGPAPAAEGARKRLFQTTHARITAEAGLSLPPLDGLSDDVRRWYRQRGSHHMNLRFPLPGRPQAAFSANTDHLLVELGFRGGVQPHASRPLTSLAATYVEEQGEEVRAAFVGYEDDLAPFPMEVLKPERTFAEKLLALHTGMVGGNTGTVKTRHYYDVCRLYEGCPDVTACLDTEDFPALLREAAEISNLYYQAGLDLDRLSLRASPAFAPTAAQRRALAARYAAERDLYFRGQPPFDELMARIDTLRAALPD